MFSDVALALHPIEAGRLVLLPVSPELAEAVLAGDVSAINAADGWPHDDTVDGLRMALLHDHAPGWFVTLDDVVIGDCGVHGEPDQQGEVEIGFGLAEGCRGRGYGRELVRGMSEWLLAQPEVKRVCARVAPDNHASKRVLELAGFRHESDGERYARYVLDGAGG